MVTTKYPVAEYRVSRRRQGFQRPLPDFRDPGTIQSGADRTRPLGIPEPDYGDGRAPSYPARDGYDPGSEPVPRRRPGAVPAEVFRRTPLPVGRLGRRLAADLGRLAARGLARRANLLDWYEAGYGFGQTARDRYDQWVRERSADAATQLEWLTIEGPMVPRPVPVFGPEWNHTYSPAYDTAMAGSSFNSPGVDGYYGFTNTAAPNNSEAPGYANSVSGYNAMLAMPNMTQASYANVVAIILSKNAVRNSDSSVRHWTTDDWWRATGDIGDDPILEPSTTVVPFSQPSTVPLPWRDRVKKGETWNQPPGESAPYTPSPQRLIIPLMPVPLHTLPWPQTMDEPMPQPEIVILDPVGQTVKTEDPPERRRDRRPRRKTKEIKVRIQGLARVAWHVINFATEGFDFIDALYRALPKRCRVVPRQGRKVTPSEKAWAVFHCADHLDGAKAVENFVNNQVEDYLYGRSSPAGPLNQLTGKPTGGGASFGRMTHTGQQYGETVSELVPSIHFDPVTGAWRLDTPFGTVGMNAAGRYYRSG